jgi:hypothetical protein
MYIEKNYKHLVKIIYIYNIIYIIYVSVIIIYYYFYKNSILWQTGSCYQLFYNFSSVFHYSYENYWKIRKLILYNLLTKSHTIVMIGAIQS